MANFLLCRLRSIASGILFYNMPGIVVASSGRSGSTMLFNAIVDGLIYKKYGFRKNSIAYRAVKKISKDYIDRLDDAELQHYAVLKTHDMYRASLRKDYKYIFVYGDPLESALSVAETVKTHGEPWFRLHQQHLCASGDYSDLYQKDVLNYQGQLESWLNAPDPNILCIDYEDLWESLPLISQFVGFEVTLPPRRPRKNTAVPADVNTDMFNTLRALYKRLGDKKRAMR